MHTHLIEIDNGESVRLLSSHIPHGEVEPLCVLVGVVVKSKVQLVIPLAPGEITSMDTHINHTSAHRLKRYIPYIWKFLAEFNFRGWSIFIILHAYFRGCAHSCPLCTVQSTLFLGFNFVFHSDHLQKP